MASAYVPYLGVAASCLSGGTHFRPCTRSLAMDNGTISSWASSVVCAALPGGVRDRLFARRFSGGYKGEFRNRISSLGVLAWRGIGIARGWYAWFAGEVFHRC